MSRSIKKISETVLLRLFPKPTVSVLIWATRRWVKEKGSWAEETNIFTADSTKTLFPHFCVARDTLCSRSYCRKHPTLTWLHTADALLHHHGVLRRDCLGAMARSGCAELCHCCYLVLPCQAHTPTWERCQIRSLLIWPWACETAGKATRWLLVCQQVHQACRAAVGVPAANGPQRGVSHCWSGNMAMHRQHLAPALLTTDFTSFLWSLLNRWVFFFSPAT